MKSIKVIILKIPAPLIMVILWLLSSQSKLPEMKGILGFDKLQHFAAYAALAAAAGLWFSLENWFNRPKLNFLIIVVVASVYGAIDEFHQYFVPGRACDVWDWIADTLGGLAGAMTVLIITKVWKSRIQRQVTVSAHP